MRYNLYFAFPQVWFMYNYVYISLCHLRKYVLYT